MPEEFQHLSCWKIHEQMQIGAEAQGQQAALDTRLGHGRAFDRGPKPFAFRFSSSQSLITRAPLTARPSWPTREDSHIVQNTSPDN